MPEDRLQEGIKKYADGWITERTGTDVPVFLKYAFVVIGLGCVAYFILYMHGEVGHAERGTLVQAFNRMTEGSDPFMYVVATMALVFVIIVVKFAFSRFHD
jgi:NADH:ubiquinone oxidoreductase subunit H